jgi:hypothetical protein
MRFILSGLWPENEAEIARFVAELVDTAAQVMPAFHDSISRELWVFAAQRSWLAEFITLTAADLQRAGLDAVTLLDRDLNCALQIQPGPGLSTVATPYTDVRSDVSIRAVVTAVDLPRSFERLDVHDLTGTMQTIVRTAVEVYNSWLYRLVCFRDGGPRLLLTFTANVPSRATSVLLNLESIEREVLAGLTMDNLKRAINVMQ